MLHLSHALLLKGDIPHCQHFIHDQDFGVEVGGDGEAEAVAFAKVFYGDGCSHDRVAGWRGLQVTGCEDSG